MHRVGTPCSVCFKESLNKTPVKELHLRCLLREGCFIFSVSIYSFLSQVGKVASFTFRGPCLFTVRGLKCRWRHSDVTALQEYILHAAGEMASGLLLGNRQGIGVRPHTVGPSASRTPNGNMITLSVGYVSGLDNSSQVSLQHNL